MVIGVDSLSRIDVDSLYGIELEEFPARIAEVAIWLTDHQMNMELSQEFGQTYIRLPLKKSANIKNGNALQMDWNFVPKVNLTILGNPPFIGKSMRNAEQNTDMDLVCAPLKTYGVLDYVSAWYVKAAQFIQDINFFLSLTTFDLGRDLLLKIAQLSNGKGGKIHVYLLV